MGMVSWEATKVYPETFLKFGVGMKFLIEV